MRQHIAAILTATSVFIPSAVFAGDIAKSVATEAVKAAFSELERQIINKYFAKEPSDTSYEGSSNKTRDKNKNKQKGKNKGMPPGLAKKDELPPGLARQVERNGTLPPGLEKRELPGDLDTKLPVPPRGYVRVIVGNDVLLVEVATGIIRDIIRGVVRIN